MHMFGIVDISTIVATIVVTAAIFGWTIFALPYLWMRNTKRRDLLIQQGESPRFPNWAFTLTHHLSQFFCLTLCCISAIALAAILANHHTLMFPTWRALFYQLGII
ncbi:hypothetical protein JOD55_000392 [Arcanobacterium pluranimalium]|uniref:hypothetical protein n=1 Tax=Arcanobacterium pluranimalium TaxID=108028 RepID=UPI00195E9DCD|nr:hypothetical protein [Arcanobacterium pluranimalium]MBM7824565.1 hypothetical protein [Arcanobacterium pluranimalium]